LSNGDSGSLLERAKFFREHIQTILNLATGSLVLSVTFLHDVVTSKAQHIAYLKRSWVIFVGCIFLGLVYNYVLAIYVRVNATTGGKKFGALLMVVSLLFHLSFIAAIGYMLEFGLGNL
jgi:hypothetical protein